MIVFLCLIKNNPRSIILKCVTKDTKELDRRKVMILTNLVQLHCDIRPDDSEDLVTPVLETLRHVSHVAWLSVTCPLSNEIFLHHQHMIVSQSFWDMVQSGLMSGGLKELSIKLLLPLRFRMICIKNSLNGISKKIF